MAFKQGGSTTTNPPSSAFFMPDKFTLYSISSTVSGTLLTIGGGTGQTNTGAPPLPAEEPADSFQSAGVPRAPWESPSDAQGRNQAAQDKLAPPMLNQRFDLPRSGSARFSIDYRIAPTSSSDMKYRSDEWKEYSDIDWSGIESILSTFGGDAGTTFNLNHSEGFYSNAVTFSGNGAWRQYSYINEEAEAYQPTSKDPNPNKVSDARKAQYDQSFFTTSYGYTHTLRPLYRSSIWGQSNLQYSFKGLLAKSAFDKDSTADDPKWDIVYGAWEKEKLTTHQFAANLAASVMDKQQNLTLNADIPPLEASLSGNATFRVWISETNARMRVLHPAESDKRVLEPFYTTETLRFGNAGSLVHYMVLDTELREFTTITSTLTLWGLKAAYTATRQQGYKLDPLNGWVLTGDEESLKSRDFTLEYNRNFTQKELWEKRLDFSVNVNSRLFFDLQRYTSSNFTFTLGFTLGIRNFVDLSLSATSENTVVFKYFKDMPMFSEYADVYPEGVETDLFKDLIDSFRFDDIDRRKSSGFKMKSFNFNAVHHLGDWKAIFGLKMTPYLDRGTDNTSPPRYDLNSEISFLVQWIPITEIKSDIKFDKRTDKWAVE
jgi:hypothetical protein